MSRPGFATGLGPTPWEYSAFAGWLVVVILLMIAMARFPAFNLLFWPALRAYDFFRDSRREGPPVPRPRRASASNSLWDRDLDG